MWSAVRCSSRAARRRRARTRAAVDAGTSTTRPAARRRCRSQALVGRRAQLPRRLADALEGDRLGFLIAGFIALLPMAFFNRSS
jgi:hypothetical protein